MPDQTQSNLDRKTLSFIFIAFSAYLLLIVLSPDQLIYDEGYYIDIAKDFLATKLSNDFIENISAPTGILYSVVHYIFSPLTAYSVPGVRFVNLLFLAISFLLIFVSLKVINSQTVNNALLNSSAWLAFPTTGVISCMALTELPSITLFLASSFLLVKVYNKGAWLSRHTSFIYLLISGILLGLSIWGRQNFVVALVASSVFFLPIKKNTVLYWIIYALPALAMFIYPTIIWQGLVPPTVGFVEEGYKLSSLVFSLGYLGVVSIILFPRFLVVGKKALLYNSMISVLIVIIFEEFRYTPSKFLIERFFGTFGVGVTSYTFGSIFVFVSLLMLYAVYSKAVFLFRNRSELATPVFYYSASIILICLSNIKSTHQFSSRYITLALPFLIYVASDHVVSTKDKYFIYRLYFSFILSLLFIVNYYDYF